MQFRFAGSRSAQVILCLCPVVGQKQSEMPCCKFTENIVHDICCLIKYIMSRGNVRSLWMGVLWALTSGTGVALALLQGSAGPLIGIAISASLLPPVVNCVSKNST